MIASDAFAVAYRSCSFAGRSIYREPSDSCNSLMTSHSPFDSHSIPKLPSVLDSGSSS
jgi:hypothetical protein